MWGDRQEGLESKIEKILFLDIFYYTWEIFEVENPNHL